MGRDYERRRTEMTHSSSAIQICFGCVCLCPDGQKLEPVILSHQPGTGTLIQKPVQQGQGKKKRKSWSHDISLSRDFNMAAPDSGDSKSNTESTVIETENVQESPVFSDGQVKDKRCSSSR